MVSYAGNQYNLPQDFYHTLIIFRFCNTVHRVMASRERRMSSLGENDSGVLIPLYESELQGLKLRLGPNISSKLCCLCTSASNLCTDIFHRGK